MRILIIATLILTATLSLPDGALGEDHEVNPYRVFIFRETELQLDGGDAATSSLPLDSEMTAAEQIEKLYSTAMSGDSSQAVDPAAYIRMNFWDGYTLVNIDPPKIGSDEQALDDQAVHDEILSNQNLHYNLAAAKAKLNSMFKSFHKPARSERDFQAIRLGASLLAHETLASNINSYVPDKFSDGEIVHMFELNEALRTGRKSLNATELAETNLLLWNLYLRALLGLKGPVGIEPDSQEGAEKCPACKDTLNAKPTFQLVGCGHKFHTHWIKNLIFNNFIGECPLCRRHFRQSFDMSDAQ